MGHSSRRLFLAGGAAFLATGAVRARTGPAGSARSKRGSAGASAFTRSTRARGANWRSVPTNASRCARPSRRRSPQPCSGASTAATFDPGEVLGFDPAALFPTSPVAARSEGRIAVIAACEAVVSYSDNTAANLLLERIGGPPALTGYFRQLGDGISRLDRYELELNANQPGDPRDTTTPRAMAGTLRRLLLGDALGIASRELLTGWMLDEQNGKGRVRAGVPATWRVANKPGTSSNGATNDIAVAWPPGGAPIVLAVFVNAPCGGRRGATARARSRRSRASSRRTSRPDLGQVVEVDQQPGFGRLHRESRRSCSILRRPAGASSIGSAAMIAAWASSKSGPCSGWVRIRPALFGHAGEDLAADLVGVHAFLEGGAELLELGLLGTSGEAALAEALGALERAGPGVGAGQRRAAQRAADPVRREVVARAIR